MNCQTCGALGPDPEVLDGETESDVKAKAIELWNRRDMLSEEGYLANVVEQTIINGRAGFLMFARLTQNPVSHSPLNKTP